MSKASKIFISAFLLFALSVGGAVGYFYFQFVHSSATDDSGDVVFEVPPGLTLGVVAKHLKEKSLIKNTHLFLLLARLRGLDHQMKVGEYMLRGTMTPLEVLSVITSGKSITRALTIAEGLNIYEIAEVIDRMEFGPKEEFLKLVKDPALIKSLLGHEADSLEGYLFPETYRITKYEGLKDIISSMVKRFLVVYQEIAPRQEAMKWTRHQVVTLASIVEKETGAPQERPLIASVFHNRLQKRMRLQTDPTIIYGMAALSGVVPTNISRKDILEPTAYNTYVINGLPPGPIANPGREALLAVVSPASSQFLYFVSRNNGTHVFSETLEKHNAAVREFQLNSKAREGKSWRDLNHDEVTK